MKRLFILLLVSISLLSAPVYVCEYSGIIGPISSRFLIQTVEKAENNNAEAIIILLDTPGGFDTAMRDIVKAELRATVPIVIFVYPSGSRDASAGVFITLAAHIAAMAPGTNIGAAHPVAMGGQKLDKEMKEKVTNDAAAYIKSIAEKRGRNAKWAEKAVRKSVSLTEKEAVKQNVVDLVANDLNDLLDKIDGRVVDLPGKVDTLHTKGAKVIRISISLKDKILSVISNPNVAYILFLLGFYGLIFEITHPGAIMPGVMGAICLILAFFAFQALPINYAGVALIVLGIVFFVLEALTPTFGPLITGGVISMLFGSLLLVNTDVPYLKVSLGVIISAVTVTALFFAFGLAMALKAMRRKPTTGIQGLTGLEGEARTSINNKGGTVFIHGELWKAYSDESIKKGDPIIVEEVKGLKLKVKRKEE